MNYERIYDELISKARASKYTGYVEVHHIKPRCIGGDDTKDNLVALTAREHFLAHWLLAKIHADNESLTYAWNMMCVGRTQSSHLYKYAREEVSRMRTGRSWGNHTEDTKKKMSKSRKGTRQGPRSDAAKDRMRLAKIGSKQSSVTVAKRVAKTNKSVISTSECGASTTYLSIKSAADSLGIDSSCISKVCKGKRKTYKGYTWRYADK